MANPNILLTDTVLYSPLEPEGRLFPAGEQWPGDAWTERKGGEPVSSGSKIEALKELIQAHDEIERLTAIISSGEHDRAQLAAEREAAKATVRGLKQQVADAERVAEESRALHLAAVEERDRARAETEALKAKIAVVDGDGDGSPGGSRKKPAADTVSAS